MKKLTLTTLTLCITIFSFGQRTSADAVLDYPWTIGLGINFINNNGWQAEKAIDTDNWNYKNPIVVEAERRFSKLLAANVTVSFNALDSNKKQNNFTIPEDLFLYAFDASAKLYWDQWFMETSHLNWFQGYLTSGLGFTNVDTNSTGSFNLGIGFQFWPFEEIGFRIQTVGKWGFKDWIYLKNYVQHSAEVIYRF